MASRKTSVWEKPLPSTIRGGRGFVSGPSTPSSSVGNTSASQPPPTANSFPPIAASSPSHLLPRPTATSSSGNAWTTVRSKRQIPKLPSSSSNINRSSDSMPTALANIPQDYVKIYYEYNCGGTVVVPRHLPQKEVIDITVKENVDPEDAVIEVSPARSANSATNVHVQTTWKAVEDRMMEKLRDEMKNVEKRLKRQFKKDSQLFVDGALFILMRNVEDMTVRKMMEVAQIPETASFGTVVEEFTKKFKCALTKDELQNLKSSSGRSDANAFARLDRPTSIKK